MISTVTSTMIQIPWLAHFSACWSSHTCVYGDIKPTVVPSLTNSSSSSSSSTMVKRRSKRNHSSQPSNQLLKQVSPFEELPVNDERYPFDEALPDERHDISEKRDTRIFSDVRDARRDDTEGGIPKFVFILADGDCESEVTLDETLFQDQEERTLTPHPSFDEQNYKPTAFDFHYLYNVSLDVGEQDWPSDEDGPTDNSVSYTFWSKGPVHKRNLGHDVMMIMKDLDDGVSKRPSQASRYRLV
jgi:hypothetical protein